MSTPDGFRADLPATVSPSVARRTGRREQRAEVELHDYALRAWVTSTKEQIDTMALGEAVRASAEEEMDTYDEMMLLAANSAVKQEIVMRKLAILSNTNNARLRRRFR